jgi:hypothetical protein
MIRRCLAVTAVALGASGIVLISTDFVAIGAPLLLLSGAAATTVAVYGWAAEHIERRREGRARKAATLGVGQVLNVRRNGRFRDDTSLTDVRLAVELPGREPYVVCIEEQSWHYLTAGRVTPIRVSPHDPQRVWIEYDPFFRA